MTESGAGLRRPRSRRVPDQAREEASAVGSALNLALDESLLRRNRWGVRAAYLTDRALSLGVGQRPSTSAAARARTLGIPVVRRHSGGTGLLHLPGDLTWSVVLPRTHPLVGNDFVSGYPRLGAGVVTWLADFGLSARWSEPFALSESHCLLGSRGRVLVVGPRAIGGAAQHLTRSALLHQGTICNSLDRGLLADLFNIGRATLEDHLTCLSELGVVAAPSELAKRLEERLGRSVDADGPTGAS